MTPAGPPSPDPAQQPQQRWQPQPRPQYSIAGMRRAPLAYWLSPDASRLIDPAWPTALRCMAWNRGQYRGLTAALLGLATTGFGAAILSAVIDPFGIGLIATLLAVAAALLAGGWIIRARTNRAILKTIPMMASRGPRTMTGGIIMTIFFGLLFLAGASPILVTIANGPGGIAASIGTAVLVLLGTMSVFLFPPHAIQHAERDFRRLIERDPGFRHKLEAMSLTWTDPLGRRDFGPL